MRHPNSHPKKLARFVGKTHPKTRLKAYPNKTQLNYPILDCYANNNEIFHYVMFWQHSSRASKSSEKSTKRLLSWLKLGIFNKKPKTQHG